MSVREFAAHLGVSDRMVSKWEAGAEAIRPRPVNQAALDTSLAMATADERARFADIVAGQDPRRRLSRPSAPAPQSLRHLVRHPLDGKVMTMIDAGPFRAPGGRKPVWLPGFYIDTHLTANVEYARFLAGTGHPPPAHWPGGTYTIADDPDALHNDPVTGLTWDEAIAYARWASKELPTAMQWDRAVRGTEGMVKPDLSEWCRVASRPSRRGPKNGPGGGFRCATSAEAMLSLLSI